MKNWHLCVVAAIVLVVNSARAMEGVFDREAEVQQYLQTIATASNEEMTVAAMVIYSSGIGDPRLAKALNERISLSFDSIGRVGGTLAFANLVYTNPDDRYAIWMSHALASIGISDYESTFKRLAKSPKQGGVKSDKVRMRIRSDIEAWEWHKRKNEIMASRQFHEQGASEHISQLMNLLAADDPTFRRFALDRIHEEAINDERMNRFLAKQLQQYIENPNYKPDRIPDNLIAINIRFLGLSGDASYRPVLEKVLASNVVPGLKQHATNALGVLK